MNDAEKQFNRGRKLTLVVTIRDPEAAQWIWEALKSFPNLIYGIEVQAVGNGNAFEEIEKLEKEGKPL